jgi:hypothetical protein
MTTSPMHHESMTTCALTARLGLFAALLVAAALAWPEATLAQSDRKLDLSTPKQRTDMPKPKQTARPRSSSCSEFGAGFVRMPGSDSCVRIGGGVDVGGGGSR